MTQPPFGAGPHDNVQYHFFCDGLFFSVRVFLTNSLAHHSAWVFDGRPHELVNSSEAMQQSESNYLNLHSQLIEISAPGAEGFIRIKNESSKTAMQARFSPRNSKPSGDPFGGNDANNILKQNLEGTVNYLGRDYKAFGFCKRYWGDYPRYWGYRFLHGVTEDQSASIWTADATFGEFKYDYFEIIRTDGSHLSADPSDSYHKADVAYAKIEGRELEVVIEEIARWETLLQSRSMESLLRQRYCKMTFKQNGKIEKGVALNEICFGTVG